jgi:hypothetical protein
MTTMLQMIGRAERALSDTGNATWSDDTIMYWLIDAIRDYSQYFPRMLDYTYTVQAEDSGHSYALPSDFLSVILVEYPVAEDPPAYLVRRPRTHPEFYDREGFYDIQEYHDANAYPYIYFSEEPAEAEKWKITYLAQHDTGLDTGDTITVREDHEGILILFVTWQALRERAAAHIQDPDTTSDFLQKLSNAAMEAEQEYRRALKIAQDHRAEGAWSGPWKSDIHDPIY